MSSDLLPVAVAAAQAGAQVLRGYFRDPDLRPEEKAANDLVSEADRASERAVLGRILETFPDHRILSEEAGRVGAGGGFEWLVDPLDGTSNFLQGLPVFAVSVACRREGKMEVGVVLDPLSGDLFTAQRGRGAEWNGRPMRASSRIGTRGSFLATGYPFRALGALDAYLEVFRSVFAEARSIRRCGAAALDLAFTAAGVYDGFFEFRLSPWDLAAGVLLIEEAGGRVSDLDGGSRYLESGNLVAGGQQVYPELLRLVSAHATEAQIDARAPLAC